MLNKERHRKQPLIVEKQSESLKFKNDIIKKNHTYGYESIRSIVEEIDKDVEHAQIVRYDAKANNNEILVKNTNRKSK